MSQESLFELQFPLLSLKLNLRSALEVASGPSRAQLGNPVFYQLALSLKRQVWTVFGILVYLPWESAFKNGCLWQTACFDLHSSG